MFLSIYLFNRDEVLTYQVLGDARPTDGGIVVFVLLVI